MEVGEAWYCSRAFFVLLMGLGLLLIIFKKEIHHFDWLSKLLFISINLFTIFSFVLLFFDSQFTRPISPDPLRES